MHARQFVSGLASRIDKTSPHFPRHSYIAGNQTFRLAPKIRDLPRVPRLDFPSQPHHTTSLTLSGTTCMALKCDRSTDPAVWLSMICGYLLTARWWSCTTMQWRGVSPTDQQPEFSLQSLDADVVVDCRRWRMRGDSVSAGPHHAFQGRCHPRPARFAVSPSLLWGCTMPCE
jgi:hypothetical protein